jgi:membrane protein required for colicin V production
MLLDLILLSILLLMIGLGAWRGAVISSAGLFAMILGYVGAVAAATSGSGWVAETLAVSQLLAPAIAGTIGFVVTWLVFSALAEVLIAWDRERVEVGGRGVVDRFLGGFFGLARGGLIVVLLALLMNWLDAARDLGAVHGLAALPDAESSALAGASGTLVEAAVSTALGEAGTAGEVAARLTARPGRALGSVQTIVEDERVTELFADSMFWTLIQNDSIDYAMNRGSIRGIVHDPEMRGRFVDLGLVDETARNDPAIFRAAMAEVLSEIAPRIERLHHDPEIKALGTDPEIIALLESGNTLALINHPRIQRIARRVSADL